MEGIVKHNGKLIKEIPFHTNAYNKTHDLLLNTNPHLESQIAAIADDVAYNNHDVEDAIRAGLINIDSLKELSYFNDIVRNLYDRFPGIHDNILTYQILRTSISQMINDIIKNSKYIIEKFNIKTIEDIKLHNFFLISMSKKLMSECVSIKNFLYANVYNHPKLLEKRSNSENIIFRLFEYFEKNFNKLPNDWLLKEESIMKQRIICDYISGMTDRYASKLYKSIYG